MEGKQKDHYWYPIRVTYSREMKVKAILDEMHVESFIPMNYVNVKIKEQIQRKLVPAIHNLLFVRATKEKIIELKNNSILSSQIRYLMDHVTRRPMVVPEKQMDDFITVSRQYEKPVLYVDPHEIALKKGDRVRIISGIWQGVEGKFVRIKKGLRVVVSIPGVAAIATASIPPSFVEKINEKED